MWNIPSFVVLTVKQPFFLIVKDYFYGMMQNGCAVVYLLCKQKQT